jgi:tetratricopeptide (TPR) repeat protein
MKLLGFLTVSAGLATLGSSPGQRPSSSDDPVPLYTDLGSHHHQITTTSPRAQLYFDQGLRLMYAFNPEEARRSFQESVRLDTTCAMCSWGVALSYGPNINVPMDSSAVRPAWVAVRKAVALSSRATEGERALIRALATRYPPRSIPDRAGFDTAYAAAMAEIVRRAPDDLDAATLRAEAMLDLRPWDQWTAAGEPRPGTLDLVEQLESVIARNPDHPGACHLYIHAVEASLDPIRALPCAERLAALMPGAGHLVHMPAHIYFRVGRYADAIAANHHAAEVDERFIRDRQPAGTYPSLYYPHNLHFLAVASAWAGQSAAAVEAARRLERALPAAEVAAVPALEYYVPLVPITLARFGRWKEVLAEPAPPSNLRFVGAISHYTRGLALAATGRAAEAGIELDSLRADVPSEAGGPVGPLILRVARLHLEGELIAAGGQIDSAVTCLNQAVIAEDSLPYTEPPWAYFPLRQRLGAMLLRAGRGAEAEAIFRQDLGRFPGNGWSLDGLAASLRRQGKGGEADSASALFRQAWQGADVRLTGSVVMP